MGFGDLLHGIGDVTLETIVQIIYHCIDFIQELSSCIVVSSKNM